MSHRYVQIGYMKTVPYFFTTVSVSRVYLEIKSCIKVNFVKSQVRSLHTSALNEVFSNLVPLRGQESESVLTVICTK